MSFYDHDELAALGLKCCGANVLISRKASVYGAERIAVGDHVRIDDYAILSAGAGGMTIGSHVHIAALATIIGAAEIRMGDFCGISSHAAVYSSSDDFSGRHLTGPTVPDRFKKVDNRPVYVGRHVVVGCHSVVLPGSYLGDSCAIGTLSLVNGTCKSFTIYGGNPLREVRPRSDEHLAKERELLEIEGDGKR